MNWIHAHPWVLLALIVFGVVLGTVAYLILLERKIASWTQDRVGPNRVGPGGLLQPMADGLKFVLKEDYRPGGVDRLLFTVAPILMMTIVIVSIAVVPLGGEHQLTRAIDVTGQDRTTAVDAVVPVNGTIVGTPAIATENGRTIATVTYRYPFQIARLNIGVLFIIAVLSLAVYGIVIGGWASNNKYSFLGGLRATAQMISYEIPLGLSLLTIVLMFGTLDLADISAQQSHYWLGFIPAWNVFCQPLAFLMFLVCIHAEANRAPFDLAEAEQELVGGYHTEYSSMRFALFFLAEYAGMITTSAVCVALFFGGWHLPWLEWAWPALKGDVDALHPEITTLILACIVRAAVFFVKLMAVIGVFMWVRWSLPRFRFDQLMQLAWRAMIPLSLAGLMVTAIIIYLMPDQLTAPGADLATSPRQIGGWLGLALVGANAALLIGAMIVSRLLPAAPPTNRRVAVSGSRFTHTPLPAPLTTNN